MTLHVDAAGAGPDLVLLHGWGLHSGAWAEVVPSLAARFRVHAVDLPGHGRSARSPAARFDDAVDELAALVPDGAAICGWSLGGLLAQRLAQRHPAKARQLVLAAATPCFVERPDWPHGMNAATLDAFAAGLEGNREATLANFVRLNALHGAHGRDAIRAFTGRLFERGGPDGAALATTLGWLRDTDLRHDTAAMRVAALVIHGTRDALAPIQAGHWLATNIHGAQLVELSDAAHLPFFTHRQAFLDAVESFVG